MTRSFRESLTRLPDQIEEAPLREGGPLGSGGALLVGGVGGSAAAGDFLELLRGDSSITRVLRESTLPADVETGDRLVVLSYSGNTRESLTLWREASRAGLRRGAVASGGALLACISS